MMTENELWAMQQRRDAPNVGDTHALLTEVIDRRQEARDLAATVTALGRKLSAADSAADLMRDTLAELHPKADAWGAYLRMVEEMTGANLMGAVPDRTPASTVAKMGQLSGSTASLVTRIRGAEMRLAWAEGDIRQLRAADVETLRDRIAILEAKAREADERLRKLEIVAGPYPWTPCVACEMPLYAHTEAGDGLWRSAKEPTPHPIFTPISGQKRAEGPPEPFGPGGEL